MEKFSNQLTDAELERLAILSEEMGEAQQVIGKIIRHGYESFDPARSEEMFIETKGTNRCDLEKELGDVLTAVEFMVTAKDVREMAIQDRELEKRQKIKPYLHHQLAPAPSPGVTSEQARSEQCGKCGDPRESTVHMTDSKNTEIRMGAHAFVPDDYVAWLRFRHDDARQWIEVCDSDSPGAFRVYRAATPVCHNPNHALCDGTPSPHEIGASCMASLPARPENEPARDYDFHGNPPNLPREQEIFWRGGERWIHAKGKDTRLLELSPCHEQRWRAEHPDQPAPARPGLDKDEGGRWAGTCNHDFTKSSSVPGVEGARTSRQKDSLRQNGTVYSDATLLRIQAGEIESYRQQFEWLRTEIGAEQWNALISRRHVTTAMPSTIPSNSSPVEITGTGSAQIAEPISILNERHTKGVPDVEGMPPIHFTQDNIDRLAKFIAQKEAFRCKTLDESLYHQSKWQRIIPEAEEMLKAAFAEEVVNG